LLEVKRRKSKRGALRLETNLSTQPPAPRQNARLSHSDEHSGGAQCFAAPPSEEPLSLDSLKRSFGLSSFPQDFSAATTKRVSAGLRRRAAPQRVTMHGFLPAQRITTFTLGNHYAGAFGECCPPQSPAPPGARSVPPESSETPHRVGHPGESPRGGGESSVPCPSAGIVACLSSRTSSAIARPIGYREQVAGNRDQIAGDRVQVTGYREDGVGYRVLRPVPCHLLPMTFGAALKLLALGVIRFYQACLSPVLPSTCRFYPSCSTYAFEAVESWGAWKGSRLALRRLLRCRPWGGFGYDPVPEKKVPGVRC